MRDCDECFCAWLYNDKPIPAIPDHINCFVSASGMSTYTHPVVQALWIAWQAGWMAKQTADTAEGEKRVDG
jgi:hypothetical protein